MSDKVLLEKLSGIIIANNKVLLEAVDEKIVASEKRLEKKIVESEKRTTSNLTEKIDESKDDIIEVFMDVVNTGYKMTDKRLTIVEQKIGISSSKS